MTDNRKLRMQIRGLRRNLTDRQIRLNSLKLARAVSSIPEFARSRRVAFYLSSDGEISPEYLMQRAYAMGKRCFLPVLAPTPGRALWFVEYHKGDTLVLNRFGIGEPVRRKLKIVPAWGLDLVFVPLVAFDASCNRIGMGGGYYDKTLSFLSRRRFWRRPRLIGLAHELQKIPSVDRRCWDIPMDRIVTEQRNYQRSNSRLMLS